jgi:hypothetical protein
MKSLTFALILFMSTLALGQSSGSVSGTVTDPSGAVISNAEVTLAPASGKAAHAQSGDTGEYLFKNVAPGDYTISVGAKGFAQFTQAVTVTAGKAAHINAELAIEVEKQQVNVQSESATVDVNPGSNAGALVLKGKDLDTLSDDPDELANELQALAGPSAGPNGGQLYIDGFTGGQLPPKASIREIRINQNPFSAEYDKLGYGRIEIFTKPGTDKFHGQFFFSDNNSIFNSRSPFAVTEPDYQSEQYSANVGGPMGKKASFFINAERRNIDDVAIVNALTLDNNFNPAPFTATISTPRTRTNITPRIDVQLTPTNTLTARYQFVDSHEQNSGVGELSLPTLAFNSNSTEHTVQISDTQTFGANVVNDTRFQFIHSHSGQSPVSSAPTVSVLGALTSGGSSAGISSVEQNRYELQNYTSMVHGNHMVRVGGRLRATSESSDQTGNFNGTFTFGSLAAYQATLQGQAQGLTAAQIRANGGGADQFTRTAGLPGISNTYLDLGLFGEDDWKFRPNMVLSYGLRYETQNDLGDHADFAPRLGFAWGIGGDKKKAAKTVLRAGYGVFYDRFDQGLFLQTLRLNGITQQQFVVSNPDFFPNVPSPATLATFTTAPTIYRASSHLRAPYTSQVGTSLERQLSKYGTLTLTYLNSRGVHQFLSANVNAPLPGTFDPSNPASAVRPFGNVGNIYEYVSEGVFKQNQLITNFNIRAGTRFSLFGYYSLSYANTNTNGAGSFPVDQFNLASNYGRAAFDVRNRLFFGGNLSLPYGFQLNPFLIANSGRPFNLTLGRDLNGDSIFNDRPALASDLNRPSVVQTRYGAFDTDPLPGEQVVPLDYATGPGQFTFNLRVSKSFGFGPVQERAGAEGGRGGEGGGRRGGGGGSFGGMGGGARGGGGMRGGPGGQAAPPAPHRYNLTLSLQARNVFNNVNLSTPVGNLNSPLFGKSLSLAGGAFNSQSANRRIDMQLRLSF